MRAYSLNELFNLTRAELFALHAGIAARLAMLPEHERDAAFEILRLIRRALSRTPLVPH